MNRLVCVEGTPEVFGHDEAVFHNGAALVRVGVIGTPENPVAASSNGPFAVRSSYLPVYVPINLCPLVMLAASPPCLVGPVAARYFTLALGTPL
mgnify:FL=1